MYATDFYIDSVQNAKKQFVETWVADESIRTKMIDAIQSQTDFAKTAIAGSYALGDIFVKNFTDAVKQK